MPLVVGHILETRYRIDALLGQGGMGAVYRATDLRFNTVVAIKENQRATPEAQKQFAREAGILHRLRHPNLPRVSDYFFVQGQGQYLVMDYIEGQDLGQILAQRGKIPEAQALTWIGQVLDALEYLHNEGIVHRDIKPANIKINPQGQVFLVDFGLAKVYTPLVSTTNGARGATPGYAPPEQYGGLGRTDARSDVYSIGATLYATLTGHKPPDSVDLMVGHATLPPPRQLNPAISRRTESAILKAMQPRATDRYQAISEMRVALAVHPLPTAPPKLSSQHTADQTRITLSPDRHQRLTLPGWALAGGAVALLLIVTIISQSILRGGRRDSGTMTPEPSWTIVAAVTPTWTSTSTFTPRPTATPKPPTGTPLSTHTSKPSTETPTLTHTPSDPTVTVTLTPTPSVAHTATESPVSTTTRTPTRQLPTTAPQTPNLQGKIAFRAWHASDQSVSGIFLMDLQSGKRTRIGNGSWPILSPDGGSLGYVGRESRSITVLDLRTWEERVVVNAFGEFAFSQDGQRIARGNSVIYVWEQGAERLLTQGFYPAWSPDDQWIAYYWGGAIKKMPVSGGSSVDIAVPAAYGRVDWGPGNRIVFVKDNDIYAVNADGSTEKQLTVHPANDYDPAWSPDGKKVIFVSERDGNKELYVMDADGNNQIRLTFTPESEQEPSWSP